MATQKRAEEADLWFVATEGSPKLRDIDADPHVNLSYYKDRTREWGVAVHAAVFLEMDKPQPVVLFELMKGWVTGDEPDLGKMHHIG